MQDKSQAYYICEQVSHHPPVSAYFYACPAKGITISGEIHPVPKFAGNSASTQMGGGFYLTVGQDRYFLTPPNIYARGLLFGAMFMELGDTATIQALDHDMNCEIEFKTKAFFGHSEGNEVVGRIKKGGALSHKISGHWSSSVYIHKEKEKSKTELFGPLQASTRIVRPLADQEEFESQKYSLLM